MTDSRDRLVILDPTAELDPIGRHAAARPAVLKGTVGLVDISKPRGDVFLDEVERLIHDRFGDVVVERFQKPTFTKPTPDDLRAEVAERCDAVIQALAD